MIAVPLTAFLVVAAILFAIGVYAVVAQRTVAMILMGIELVLNAVGLNLVAFWRFVRPGDYSAQIFTIVVVTIGAIEMAVGLGIVMLLYRARRSAQVDDYARLRG